MSRRRRRGGRDGRINGGGKGRNRRAASGRPFQDQIRAEGGPSIRGISAVGEETQQQPEEPGLGRGDPGTAAGPGPRATRARRPSWTSSAGTGARDSCLRGNSTRRRRLTGRGDRADRGGCRAVVRPPLARAQAADEVGAGCRSEVPPSRSICSARYTNARCVAFAATRKMRRPVMNRRIERARSRPTELTSAQYHSSIVRARSPVSTVERHRCATRGGWLAARPALEFDRVNCATSAVISTLASNSPRELPAPHRRWRGRGAPTRSRGPRHLTRARPPLRRARRRRCADALGRATRDVGAHRGR